MTSSERISSTRYREGMTLLEVLVACGILVVALGSIAAILPAAASRLADATAHDRAAATAVAAMADIQLRNLATRSLFPTGTWGSSGSTYLPSAVVFGETLSLAMTSSATSAGYVSTSGSLSVASGSVALTAGGTVPIRALFSSTVAVLSDPVPKVLNSRMNADTVSADRRGFFLEDEVQYAAPTFGDLPANTFTSGVRSFNPGVCWGAMITPVGGSFAATTAAKISVAVFRKPGNATALTLTAAPTDSSTIFVTGNTTPVSLQRSILKPCSMVLAVNGTATPQWLPIRSSWSLTGTMIASTGNSPTCVTFSGTVPSALINAGTLNVIGFENLLLVDEKIVPLP